MKKLLLPLLLLPLLAACGEKNSYVPKPTAYMRLSYPTATYHTLDTLPLPFIFDIADSARIELKKNTPHDKWIDLTYPSYNAVVFLTYKTLTRTDDLAKQVNDCYEMLSAHYTIASGIDEQQFVNPQGRVYATVCHLAGRNVATTYQFWVTDSLHHFLHGSFYLDRTPNNDSLQPLINHIQLDLDHLLETLSWRQN